VLRQWSRPLDDQPEMVDTPSQCTREEFIPVYVTENMVGHKLGEIQPSHASSKGTR